MTQDEVDLIYDYLHENYEYKDGEFYSLTSRGGKDIGSKLGNFIVGDSKFPALKTTLDVYKRKTYKLTTLVWIYHYKEYQKYIAHKDGNIANTNIENLLKSTAKLCQATRKWVTGCYQTKGGGYFCAIKTSGGHMGVYSDKKTALEVYSFARDSYFNKHIELNNVRQAVKEKYGALETKNTKEVKGWYKVANKYQVVIRVKGKAIYVGSYDSPQEATKAFIEARSERDINNQTPQEAQLHYERKRQARRDGHPINGD